MPFQNQLGFFLCFLKKTQPASTFRTHGLFNLGSKSRNLKSAEGIRSGSFAHTLEGFCNGYGHIITSALILCELGAC